jgi:GTP cyclohydrolase I
VAILERRARRHGGPARLNHDCTAFTSHRRSLPADPEVALADFPEPRVPAPMPDVVSEQRSSLRGALDWVGMRGIALPIRLQQDEAGAVDLLAKASLHVNLVPQDARGIHMSRLYRALDAGLARQSPTPARLEALLGECLASHAGLSDQARLALKFELPLQRSALRSGLRGWRAYPVELVATLGPAGFRCDIALELVYSSTCPGSAALARQLVRRDFEAAFAAHELSHAGVGEWLESAAGVLATPHAQRSVAHVRMRFVEGVEPALADLVDRLEAALGTPVQTAVKREDEQAFARLNGENPMYCEDAARRLRASLETMHGIFDYHVAVAHLESLHPHDATAVVVRGVSGGFRAQPD